MGQHPSLQGEAGDLLPLGPYSWGGGTLAGPGYPPDSAYLLARDSSCPRQPAPGWVHHLGNSTQHRRRGRKGGPSPHGMSAGGCFAFRAFARADPASWPWLFPCRYPGDSLCVCHHGGWGEPRHHAGLQHGRAAAVWLRADAEPGSPLAHGGSGHGGHGLGVGGLRGRRAVRLREIPAVHGCQEQERQK